MARARVELKEGATYGPGLDGRIWKNAVPQILSDPRAISFYKNNSRFLVTELISIGKVKSITDISKEGLLEQKETKMNERKSKSKNEKETAKPHTKKKKPGRKPKTKKSG